LYSGKEARDLMIPVQPVFDLEARSWYGLICGNGGSTTYISWIFCDAIANTLLDALEILVKEALIFDEHGGR
jgi:hypothetical protein